jgi:argininosuccinate lyase
MTDLVAMGLTPNVERMRDAAREGHATATDLADYLVRKGVPFRDAHEIVARAVREAEARNCELAALPLDELRLLSPLMDADALDELTLEGSVGSRGHVGGTAPRQVRAAIEAARHELRTHEPHKAGSETTGGSTLADKAGSGTIGGSTLGELG